MSAAAKAAISARMKGKQTRLGAVLSKETKDKIGNSNRGRRPSAETHAKMSAAQKKRYEKK